MRRTRRACRTDDGFTLVELLIVIIVLGVLAAIVVFAVGSTRDDAVESACATRVRSIVSSAEAVNVKTDAYPVGTIDATTAPNPLVAPSDGALLTEWPTDSNFVVVYDSVDGSAYDVKVFESDGVTEVTGCGDLS